MKNKKNIIFLGTLLIGVICAAEVGNSDQKLEATVSDIRFGYSDAVKVSNVPLKIDPISGDAEPENFKPKEGKIYVYVPSGYEVTIVPVKKVK